MSRRAFLKSLTALAGGFALPAVARAKPNLIASKTLQVSVLAAWVAAMLWRHIMPEGY